MIIVAIALLIAFVVTGVVLGRQTSNRKKEAIESLKAEKAALRSVSILDLAREEIEELGLDRIPGTEDLATDVILKVWKDAGQEIRDCDRSELRYVIADGIDPHQASVRDVRIVCDSVGDDRSTDDAGGSDTSQD
jgi:hypothetical protein